MSLPATVTFGDFFAALATQLDRLDPSALEPNFAAFAARHGAQPTPELRREFLRLWATFEATRDGGWWRLRWQVTDQEPTSLQIWKAWERKPPVDTFATASAVAECDEITALFAVTARRLGVRGVGLFYPTWNHVIAGWSRPGADTRASRDVVLIPTTQIYQSCEATFDATTFKTPKQVYEFPRYDVRDDRQMSRELAEFLLAQVRAYGEASPELLALIRAKRAELLGSSLGNCQGYRAGLLSGLRGRLTCADRRALRHLAAVELEQPTLDEGAVLAFLADARPEP